MGLDSGQREDNQQSAWNDGVLKLCRTGTVQVSYPEKSSDQPPNGIVVPIEHQGTTTGVCVRRGMYLPNTRPPAHVRWGTGACSWS